MDNNKKSITVALAGNPNSGKTTIFNAITGSRQHVGNYPGVTVERKESNVEIDGENVHVIDLPGTYSLTAYSPDELVARRALLDESPDVVIQVIDAGNLERNLYLTSQLLPMKVPLVLAFNMMDEVKKRGMKINVGHLSALLDVPIIETVGYKEEGIQELVKTALEYSKTKEISNVEVRYGGELDRAIDIIQSLIEDDPLTKRYEKKWLAIKLLEGDDEILESMDETLSDDVIKKINSEQERIRKLLGDEPDIVLADARYGWVHGAVSESVSLTVEGRRTLTDKIDTVLANRLLGFPIFLFFMWITFEATFTLGAPLMDLIELGFSSFGSLVEGMMAESLLRSLLVDGIIAGVGGVMVFLPNIMILFMMVSIMEDSGYMARAAFIVDRVMHMVGLHGKSFIPMFVGFGCNVPAIMAARVLENERDRITTILVAPFISCSARLPVYILLTGTFFAPHASGKILFSLYILGILVAMISAKVLRAYVVKGPPTPFVMELPPYRIPTLKSVAIHMWERAFMYAKKAGTIILAMSIVIWFLSNFPQNVKYSPKLQNEIVKAGSEDNLSEELKLEVEKEKLEKSYAGMFGHAVAPFFKPVGLDNWRVTVSLCTGLVAKEIVVSTMSTLYSLGEQDETSSSLSKALKNDPFFTPLRAYALMVFILLYVPCLAAVVVAYRELGSWKWTMLMVGMSTGIAYFMTAAVYWGGTLLGL